jgi:hypothetical protein
VVQGEQHAQSVSNASAINQSCNPGVGEQCCEFTAVQSGAIRAASRGGSIDNRCKTSAAASWSRTSSSCASTDCEPSPSESSTYCTTSRETANDDSPTAECNGETSRRSPTGWECRGKTNDNGNSYRISYQYP